MILGIERRQVPASVADERSKSIEGVRMNTSKVNESAPMIVRVVQGTHDPRIRRVFSRSAPGDTPAGLGWARGPRRDHTNRALRRVRGGAGGESG